MKKLNFIINTSEITAGTRGASLGPGAIMVEARKRGSFLFGNYSTRYLENENHLLDAETKHQFGKRIEGLKKVFENVSTELNSVFKSGSFPLVLAADHGSAGGTIAGIKTSFPDKRLGVIWIDAHADLHSPYTTPSGNMHGMPLATAISEDNLICKSNDVPAETTKIWEELKNLGGINPKIKAEDIVFVGVRDTEEQEDALIERFNIKNVEVSELNSKGCKQIADEVLAKLAACDIIYISFDVDSMEPSATSHGTGTPVDNGLLPKQAEDLMLHLLDSPKVVCLEIVEVNPCLDEKTNKMAETTFQILEKLVAKITQ